MDDVVAHANALDKSAAKVEKALFGRSAREEGDDDDEEEEEEESATSKGLVGLSADQNVS